MSVVIRLRKAGKSAKKRYNFRIVACDSGSARDGRFIEELGYYDAAKNPAVINFKRERVEYWRKNGAKLSDTVASLFKKGAK